MRSRKALYHLKWFILETLGIEEKNQEADIQHLTKEEPLNPVDFYRKHELVPPVAPPVFATGTGRCGTHFFGEIFAANEHYFATHADHVNSVGDTFHQYCRFHDMNIDLGGLLWARKCLMDKASKEGKMFVESNALICLHVLDLHKAFDAPVLGIFRSPVGVVPSSKAQGVYSRDYIVENPNLPSGFQYNTLVPNHSFGSIIPSGDAFAEWAELTETGKVAWRWDYVNRAILDQMESIPEDKKKIICIENFDYDEYLSLDKIMDLKPLTREAFDSIRERKPGKTGTLRVTQKPWEWSSREREEFMRLTGETANRLGYDIERELAEVRA